MKTVSSRFTAADTGTTDTGTIDAMGIIGPKGTIGLIVTIDTATIAGRDSTSTSGPDATTAISDIIGDAERNHTQGLAARSAPRVVYGWNPMRRATRFAKSSSVPQTFAWSRVCTMA